MFIAAHEWSQPRAGADVALEKSVSDLSLADPAGGLTRLYRQLADRRPDESTRCEAAVFLLQQLACVESASCDLPETPEDLGLWMEGNAQRVAAKYSIYLEERKGGAPRRYFTNRAHALYFLRTAAPTKLVDGAWLYGLIAHWRNPKFSDLVRTYVEELGEGMADKNHVVLYRNLLSRHGLDPVDDLDDSFYVQGLIQLALGWNAETFLPEIIGFNLGYEQLPLHLLITAYELNELGLDPYYFTLHVTVDNSNAGHARRACQAVVDTLPRLGDAGDYWRRVRRGSKLGDVGAGTNALIDGFDIGHEVVRIFKNKSSAGRGAHSDYCRVAGLSVNQWLADAERVPAFLAALREAGWIRLGQPVEQSRFWALLQGTRAEMFGVFSSYELQVIHDWLRGPSSVDGRAYTQAATQPETGRTRSFRATVRLAAGKACGVLATGEADVDLLDTDLQALTAQLVQLDEGQQLRLLVEAMSPAQHWGPAGLHATRLFWEMIHERA